MTVNNKKRNLLAARRGSAKRIVIAASGIALGLAIAITVAAQQIGGRTYDQPNQWRPASSVSEQSSLQSGGSFVPSSQTNTGQTNSYGRQDSPGFVPSVPSSASIIDPRTQVGQGFSLPDQTSQIQNNNNYGATNNVNSSSPRVASVPYVSVADRTFQLQNVSCEQFESALVKTWGPDLQRETQNYGRQLRVLLPNRENQHAEMIIDRQKGEITFFGPDSLVAAWRKAMSILDVSQTAGGVVSQLVGMGKAKPETVNKAMTLISTLQDDAANIQNPNAIGNPQQDQAVAIQGLGQQDQTQQQSGVVLGRPVTFEYIESSNSVILRGAPEDVARVKKVLQQIAIAAQQNQPEIRIFKLEFSNSQSLRDTLQELWDQIYSTRYGTVSISAISSPNSILAVGQKGAVDAIGELVTRLDIPSPDPSADFKVYRLRFMSSPDAKNRIDTYFGAQQNQAFPAAGQQQSTAPVLVISDYRSNSIIVKASKRELVLVDELIQRLDIDGSGDPAGAEFMVEIIPLKNALASELALSIQDAINGQLAGAGEGFNQVSQTGLGGIGGVGQQQLPQPTTGDQSPAQIPSRSLTLMTIDQDGKKITSGLMFDVRVSSSSNSNALIVVGPQKSMALIKELVRQLDKLPDAETQLKVFTIVNGQAELIVQQLQQLFGGANANLGGFGGFGGLGGGATSQLPLQSGNGTEGVTLVNLRFGVDTRTNSIIVSGPIGDLKIIEDLITRLDEQDFRTRQVSVFRLNNLGAEDMATAINAFLDSRRNLNTLDPNLISPYDQADREIIVIPEPISNSLIVSATPRYYPQIQGIIRALDRRPPMVKVKVTIAEVQLSALKEIGLEYGVQDSLIFDRGIGTVGFPFNQAAIGNNNTPASLATRENLAGQGLLNLNVGRTNSDLGYGGLVLSAGNESINVLFRMLKNRNAIRVLSSPHIMTVDNLTASVLVGARVPRVNSVTTSNFGISNGIVDTDVGIILSVTPRVNPDGSVILAIDVVNSNVGPEAQGIPIFVTDTGQVIRSPQINTTQAQTTLLAQSGQTIMFGGLITERKSETQRGVPFFSDLPTFGPLFRFTQDAQTRSELLIIMTPYIVESEEEITVQNQMEMDRMHWCLSDVVEMHGSLGLQSEYVLFDHSRPEVVYPDQHPTVEGTNRPQDMTVPQSNNEYEKGIHTNGNAVIQPAGKVRSKSVQTRDSSIPIGTAMPIQYNNSPDNGSELFYQNDSDINNQQWQPSRSESQRQYQDFGGQR